MSAGISIVGGIPDFRSERYRLPYGRGSLNPHLLDRHSTFAQIAGACILVIDAVELCEEEEWQRAEIHRAGSRLVNHDGKAHYFAALRYYQPLQFRQLLAGPQDIIHQQ